MDTKKCTGECGKTLPATEEHFGVYAASKDGLTARCRICKRKAEKEGHWRNIHTRRESKRKLAAIWYSDMENVQKRADYYLDNTERCKASTKKWRKENPARVAANAARRRAKKLNQTPPDADHEAIVALFEERNRLNKIAGYIKWHVDHIIPLSKGGPHHQDNMRVMLGVENLRKGTKSDEAWELQKYNYKD